MRTVRRAVVAALLVVAVPARAEDPAEDAARDVPGRASRVVERFRVDQGDLEQALRVPFSVAWFDRREAFLAEWEERTESLLAAAAKDRAASLADRLDLVLLRDHVRHERSESSFERSRLEESLVAAPFARDLAALEEERRRMEIPSPEGVASRLDAARKSVEEFRGKVEKGVGKKPAEGGGGVLVVDPVVALRMSRQLDALRGTLRDWFRDRDGYEPEFAWWVRKPWQALDGALESYSKLLREKVAGQTEDGGGPLVGDPIGAKALRSALDAEYVPYTPAEILAIAEREFAWCEAEARKAAAEMGLGDDWKAALAKVKSLHVPPGRQDELVAMQSREAIEFVTSRDLVTVPDLCRATWRLQMIPEDRQKTMPYAYYSGQEMGVAYPTDAMDHDRKLQAMRGNNVHFSRIVTPHELIPGHHLQIFVAERHRPHRSLFRTPFLVEGWALYWEMRLWDLGWAQSPEDRMGMLFWRMHRCARILVTLRFHLGEMTTEQMVDFLVDRVGHERDGATAEVRRYVGGGYGPLYQAAYMLGGLQIRSLHAETVGVGKLSERDFHDRVLRLNAVPVRMIRAELLGEDVGPDGPSPWRFADR